jgi:uncharacterized protein (TIGR02145 family)
MKKLFSALLLFALAAYGQQERIAIIQTVDDGDSIKFSELAYLTNKLRETAVNVLPKSRYGVMTTESIVAFLGSQERMVKECKAASCLADLGRKVNADYVAQARIGRFGKNLTIGTELYSSKNGNLLCSFAGDSKDIYGLLAIINEKAPDFFKKMPSASPYDTFTDSRDGKKYRTAKIGEQTWMTENLNYNVSDSKCYNNQTLYCDKYGRLYDWRTAKVVCPEGWHLPSNKEWDALYRYADGSRSTESPYKSETAGKLLKAKSGWNDYEGKSGSGTDAYGFSALPGGHSAYEGYFFDEGWLGRWWTITENNGGGTYIRLMGYNGEYAYWGYYDKKYLFSVRCLQD